MEPKETRIVDAAFDLFIRHGYPKVSMSDIAAACDMSRPTLYASFANKEAIFAALVLRQRARSDAATAQRLPLAGDIAAQLACLFEIWVIEPAASVIHSPNGIDMMANCGSYAPRALADIYDSLEAHLAAVLAPAIGPGGTMSAREIAYILRVATTGIKASADSLPTLQQVVAGMITMAVATVGAQRS
ncbi:TetR family transcriptional regulator [Pseudoduganella lurida]|uniref:TetR family transcriptional regulator n=1 Tax=Pseudoduganella lurida TaxID=1036180 RepID=A0A562R8M7_9BURK|nr:TetR/AcrR family transcriptional regulator [Pseudoduganella lurida]TWI65411.1 TetR family transcriptional regulator [Pseudoduganella lurida]